MAHRISRIINSSASLDQVMVAVEQSFRNLGGGITRGSNSITITNGKDGIPMAFGADINANLVIRQMQENQYEIVGNVERKPNTVFWICLVAGFFFLWPLWIVNLMYFGINPLSSYQQALNSVQVS